MQSQVEVIVRDWNFQFQKDILGKGNFDATTLP